MIRKLILILCLIAPLNANALIEVDITRGNLSPLPIAVSPLSIDENSKKNSLFNCYYSNHNDFSGIV